jgi:uncharacterized RDD family membrane protein YckC
MLSRVSQAVHFGRPTSSEGMSTMTGPIGSGSDQPQYDPPPGDPTQQQYGDQGQYGQQQGQYGQQQGQYGQQQGQYGYGQPQQYGSAYPEPYSAPPGMYPDPISGLLLPNGTELAGVGRRIGAYFLSILLFIVTLGIGYVIWGLILWPRGQTPTFQVLKMRCFRPETNQVASFGWMALREIIGRLVDGILGIFTGIASFVLMLVTRERRALHDMIAGTVVLYDPNKVLG